MTRRFLLNPPGTLTDDSPTPCCNGRLTRWLVRYTAGVGRDFTYTCSTCDTVRTQHNPARFRFAEGLPGHVVLAEET